MNDEPVPASGSGATLPRRHYKKDSRFVNDLYTLTYDDNESLDTVELKRVFNQPEQTAAVSLICYTKILLGDLLIYI